PAFLLRRPAGSRRPHPPLPEQLPARQAPERRRLGGRHRHEQPRHPLVRPQRRAHADALRQSRGGPARRRTAALLRGLPLVGPGPVAAAVIRQKVGRDPGPAAESLVVTVLTRRGRRRPRAQNRSTAAIFWWTARSPGA